MIFHVCFYADCSIGWHTPFLYYSPYILFNVWEMANYFSDQDHVATYFYFSSWQSSLVYCLHWTQYSIPFFSTCHNCSLKCNPSCHEFNHVVWSTTLVILALQVATFILQKIMLDDTGLAYVCASSERFCAVANVLAQMVEALAEQPSPRTLKNTIRCYLRLTDDRRFVLRAACKLRPCNCYSHAAPLFFCICLYAGPAKRYVTTSPSRWGTGHSTA